MSNRKFIDEFEQLSGIKFTESSEFETYEQFYVDDSIDYMLPEFEIAVNDIGIDLYFNDFDAAKDNILLEIIKLRSYAREILYKAGIIYEENCGDCLDHNLYIPEHDKQSQLAYRMMFRS